LHPKKGYAPTTTGTWRIDFGQHGGSRIFCPLQGRCRRGPRHPPTSPGPRHSPTSRKCDKIRVRPRGVRPGEWLTAQGRPNPLRQLQLVATCHGGPGPEGGRQLTRGDKIYHNNALSGGRPRKISQLPERWDSGSVDAAVCLGEEQPDMQGIGVFVPRVNWAVAQLPQDSRTLHPFPIPS